MVTYDATPPTVTINQAAGQADPTNASPINFTVVFSEAVTGFATGDVTLSGTAGATTGTVTGSGTTYNVAGSGMTGNGTVIATVGANVAIDILNNGNAASTSTDNTVTYDNTGPSVTIDQALGQADPTGTSPINFTVVFSEAVTGFATGDVTLSGTAGATTGTVTGSGTTYNVAVSGMTGNGTVIATVGANVAIDILNNGNAASTSTDNTVTYVITVANVPPSIVTPLTLPVSPVAMGSNFNMMWTFTDPDSDNWKCKISWDQGAPFGALFNSSGNTCSASGSSLPPGVYTVTVYVEDDEGGSDQETATAYIVVYDPNGGFVTGGGWFNS